MRGGEGLFGRRRDRWWGEREDCPQELITRPIWAKSRRVITPRGLLLAAYKVRGYAGVAASCGLKVGGKGGAAKGWPWFADYFDWFVLFFFPFFYSQIH